MKIAILGTKGIPNNYGGYEQFAECISKSLVARGHSITVYNPSFHPFQESTFSGASIIRKYCPENLIGGSANIIYDFLCLKDALTRDFDIIYEAGYHSAALAYQLLGVKGRTKPVIITNMDGLEFNRSKWNSITRRLIRSFERMAVAHSRYLISDNIGIQQYYREKFGRETFYLPYGADEVEHFDEGVLGKFKVSRNEFFILVARFEPENNIDMVLDGFVASGSKRKFLVVGDHQTGYGRYLRKKYPSPQIQFTGGVYIKPELDSLRHFSLAYFHGHSVGGTNPSLLEAMASGAFIVSHDNPFNRNVLFDSAVYFRTRDDVKGVIAELEDLRNRNGERFVEENLKRIREHYNWDTVVNQHESLFAQLVKP